MGDDLPRSKDPNREYDNNGRVKPLEGPTPETALKHQERAERFHIPAHMEAGYAESTMGVLYARGMISVDQYELCKKLANLRSILFGSGNARCSSAENVGRGLPNDRETKSMRDTWTAYKAATAGIVKGDRDLFEHVVLRNNYRECMRFPDSPLFIQIEADRISHPGISVAQGVLRAMECCDNEYRDARGRICVKGLNGELSRLLRVIRTISERMPREIKAGRQALTPQHTGSIGDAQANALYGGESKLDELYMAKMQRGKQ